MPLDDLPLHASDRRLLAVLADVIDLELSTPDPVLQAAKALHDWSRVDAELAEPVAVLAEVRADYGALEWTSRDLRIRVEVEPNAYRRRRLTVMTTRTGDPHDGDINSVWDEDLADMAVQLAGGSTLWVSPDAFGERITRVPSGAVRVMARTPDAAVITPWFTI